MFDFDKILFVGDTHGDSQNLINQIMPFCVKSGIKVIFVLGDFGFWEHEKEGKDFLFNLNKYLIKYDLYLFWLDGNHENHTLLRSKYFHPEFEVDGFIKIRERIFHSPRGNFFTWGGINFMTVGGAYSIDVASRVIYKSHWPEETIANDEFKAIISTKNVVDVDVLLTHDVIRESKLEKTDEFCRDTEYNRFLLSEIAECFKIKMNIHGHYHTRESQIVTFDDRPQIQIESLAHNYDLLKNQIMIFDCKEYFEKWHPTSPLNEDDE